MAEKKKKGLRILKRIKIFKRNVFAKNKKEAKEFLKEKKKLDLYMKAYEQIQRTRQANINTGGYAMDSGGNWDEDVYFYDFLKEWNNSGTITFGGDNDGTAFATMPVTVNASGVAVGGGTLALTESIQKKEPKLVMKPKDVFHELERVPNKVDLKNLDEKIATFKMRDKFIRSNGYAKKEVIDMTLRLENRKKWDEFKDFYGKFDTTTTEKIDKLLSKYDLVMKTTDLFVPTFPKEAIDVMNEYTEQTKKLCKKKPIFYVIAQTKDFKKEYERNDPILLAQSPFGIFWDICGCWDEEILILSEL